jgi:hypothetical protein
MGPPIIPFDPANPICGNEEHPDFGGVDANAYRGQPHCNKCTDLWGGEWNEITGVCSNISTYKFKCGSYGHLSGGQDTDWEQGCCEERPCFAETCNPEQEQRGDCCGLWATSACACPANYKDCDGNIKRDLNDDPIRRPFILDLAIDGGSGGCCVSTTSVVGTIPGTEINVGGAPQTSSRIIITEST